MNSSLIDDKIYSDKKLMLKYRIQSKLGEGAFGVVYKCLNISTKREVALKVEFLKKDKAAKDSTLIKQMIMYNELKGIQGIPQIYSFQKWQHGYFIEMEILVSSLDGQRKNKLTFRQIKVYMIQILNILKKIHAKSIIHQDLKPQNIMRNSQGKLVIIDFGLSANYNFGTWHKKTEKLNFIGTPRYASLAAHYGQQQKAKDDIESLLYVLGYLYMKRIPWSNLEVPEQNRLKAIQKYKKKKNREWLSQCGKPFFQCYNYLTELTPGLQLDYGYIIKLFQYHRQSLTILQKPEMHIIRKMSTFSDSPFTINIIEKKNPFHKANNDSYRSRSRTILSNFSIKAHGQDLSRQAMQLLASFLFLQQQEEHVDRETIVSFQAIEDEPCIKKFDNLELLSFKNPFKNSHV